MSMRFAICLIFLLPVGSAYAGQFSVQCAYSHTLPDDAIIYPGQPGRAMVHDFFGNTGADAYSTYYSLNDNKVTTCNAAADLSSYWVPQLNRASGIVVPGYQKTYYKNDQPVVALQTIPAGLEMLAGDHHSSSPKPQINYLCRGGSYTQIAPTRCPVVTDSSGTYAQLDISVHFPDCWDGRTLVPNMASHIMNMAYRQSDGKCPAAYPVKIPELQLNVAYDLGQDPDLSTAQLSMDPILVNGTWVPQWGSLYTAHADFINAWKTDSLQYAVDNCSNADNACSNNIPTYYSKASADAWMDSGGVAHASGSTMISDAGSMVLIKFPTPANLKDYPYTNSYLQTLAQNVTDTSAVMLDIYAASTNWDDTANLPTAAACNTHQRIGGIYLDNALQPRNNDITPYVASQVAAGSSQIGVCIRNATGRTVQISSRDGTRTPALFMK
ncbi:protein of unknown function (DUF1996) [Burkholderia sp. Ch1-1]|uniref:Uncharacterized protein n=1 Tax=Paraburkholderia dioscoreae TaxID=2604047 RepID=A0A5Q4ZA69_9BURK|nr:MULTISPECIES: DUF1996 domain-containing protein [Paraburkholderia]EIF28678.1 protein of unknown function (DUF1996) [Burkholderia sp. Ch1-1]MDR8400547.1 DUF1996 domain-containing protein [Paraburkholderia sp. USG1]VVD26854.1 conserved exported protein of unknown function [Paraburkholderia dioscoreae]